MKNLRCSAWLAALLLPLAAHADPPGVKAKVAEPVVQELMGGCSLKCAFAWTVEVRSAPGQRPSPTKALNDESAASAWTAAGTSGVGAMLRLVFPKKLPMEMNGETPLYGLDLANGAGPTEEAWKAHGRVKKIRLSYNGKPFLDILLADSRRWQRVTFPDFFVRSGDSMTLEILEVYPGENGAGAALTELVLQGGH